MPAIRALSRILTAETAAVPVALCRIGLGAAALVRSLKTARDLYLIQYDPRVVPAPVFPWSPSLETWPEIAGLGALSIATAVGVLVGYRAQLSAFVLSASIGFLYLVDQNFWAHHMYFIAIMLLLLSLTESDRALSVRAGWRGAGAAVTAWPVLLMKIQLSLVYFFTGVAKLNGLYLSGYILRTRNMVPVWLQGPAVLPVVAALTVAVELFLAFALWFPRLRVPGLIAGVVLHGLIPVFPGPTAGLIAFSVATLSIYALFFDENDLARVLQRLASTPCGGRGAMPRARRRRRA